MLRQLRFQSTLSARRATVMGESLLRFIEQFQSTLSARRATLRSRYLPPSFGSYFNPRSPRGERLNAFEYYNCTNNISIHALREESDICIRAAITMTARFQSTLSARRATAKSNIIFTLKSTMYLHFFTKL